MTIRIIYRKVLASLMAILFFLGITGFNIEEHSCVHCGTDYRVFFIDNTYDQLSVCIDNTEADCCSEEENLGSDKNLPESCDITTEDCCKYKYDELAISDPVYLISIEFDFDTPIAVSIIATGSSDHLNPVFSRIESIPKQLSGRDIIILSGRFLS